MARLSEVRAALIREAQPEEDPVGPAAITDDDDEDWACTPEEDLEEALDLLVTCHKSLRSLLAAVPLQSGRERFLTNLADDIQQFIDQFPDGVV